MRPHPALALAALLIPLLASCADLLGTGGEAGVPEQRLRFVRAADDAPPLDAEVLSFWARPDASRGVTIRYVGVEKYKHDLCMEFTVPAGALLRHPDGRRVQPGDSVRITVRVVDPDRFVFHFEPAGLRFDPANPARLRVSYWWADPDFNGDGVVDARDEQAERSIALWRQEEIPEPWFRTGTTRHPEAREVESAVASFTRYAVASN